MVGCSDPQPAEAGPPAGHVERFQALDNAYRGTAVDKPCRGPKAQLAQRDKTLLRRCAIALENSASPAMSRPVRALTATTSSSMRPASTPRHLPAISSVSTGRDRDRTTCGPQFGWSRENSDIAPCVAAVRHPLQTAVAHAGRTGKADLVRRQPLRRETNTLASGAGVPRGRFAARPRSTRFMVPTKA